MHVIDGNVGMHAYRFLFLFSNFMFRFANKFFCLHV